MSSLLERLGVELPLVQAGMGGGIARHRLAAAVSEAGGLGTLGTLGTADAGALREELESARQLTAKPIAVNLLLPFASEEEFQIAAQADALVTFWGRPRRSGAGVWIHQCGSVEEALAAQRAGADGVIVQGIEAGGHVRGTVAAADLLGAARGALPSGFPIWLAGGIADAADVRRALDAGAEAAVLGTRFVLSEESGAQAAYRERLLDAGETLLTELFGAGWPAAPHRVVSNEATRRWTSGDPRGPAWVRAVNRLTAPLARRAPAAMQARSVAAQTPRRPFFSSLPPAEGAPPNLIEAGPLYAGESVARMRDVRPAAELVRDLAPR